MNEEQIIERLKSEGYDPVYAYTEEPNDVEEEHHHDYDTKLVIIDGYMRIKSVIGGAITDTKYVAGQEIEVSRGVNHSAQVGPEGCRYIVGEKH